ncbi:MAG TPA: ribonuclease R, partial [Rhodospirillaceae bacterium]|nr:ribonuclease R [Rhodospirillaceae bacterium]
MSKPPIPTRQQLLEFIKEAPVRPGKRELARAFHLTGENRIILREMLRELEKSGDIERGRGKRFGQMGALPESAVLEICGTDADGSFLAKPLGWTVEGTPPRIVMAPARRGEPSFSIGDRLLARLRRLRHGLYEARVQRRLSSGSTKLLGVYQPGAGDVGVLQPTDRRQKCQFQVAKSDNGNAVAGELVLAELLPGGRPQGY